MSRILSVALAALLLGISSMSYCAADPAARLSQAIQFKTISYQQRSQINLSEFRRFHTFLRASFPLVFSQLEVEKVSEYSLMIRWPGNDPDLEPILFTAHTDVVPIEADTQGDWEYPPFAGVVADGRIYGRGSLDNKQGVLGNLEAAESLLAEGFVPERTLVSAWMVDEGAW